nr:reverse transcriptase domain-containing protein [Tanacetum cinerariifolium]
PFNNQTIKELPPTVPSFDQTCYYEDGNSFTYDSISNLVHDSPNIFDPPSQLPFYFCEFCENDACYGHYCTPQVPFIYRNSVTIKTLIFCKIFMIFNNNIFVVKIASNIPSIILSSQSHKKPNSSLSMGDEHLDTISATKSDEFIKSSVENLVLNPSESEGENECDVPACEVFKTFSNILFDADYNFYSSEDQSISDEDILKEIYLNPLFDEEIISINIDPHHFNAEPDLIEYLLNHDSSIISSSSKINSLSMSSPVNSLFSNQFRWELMKLIVILSKKLILSRDCYMITHLIIHRKNLFQNILMLVPLILGRPFLQAARALIDVHGEEMIFRDGDERLTLNMRHDTSSYSNQPQKESINLINVFNNSSEDFLEGLFLKNQLSGNPTFSSHHGLTSPEVKDYIFDPEGGNVLPKKFLDLDSTKDLHPSLHINLLSGSTTYSSSPNQLLEELVDELALITFPLKYDDDLQFENESDLKEIEHLLHHDLIQDIDSSLKDSIDQSNLANLADNVVDSMPEMFTDDMLLIIHPL